MEEVSNLVVRKVSFGFFSSDFLCFQAFLEDLLIHFCLYVKVFQILKRFESWQKKEPSSQPWRRSMNSKNIKRCLNILKEEEPEERLQSPSVKNKMHGPSLLNQVHVSERILSS